VWSFLAFLWLSPGRCVCQLTSKTPETFLDLADDDDSLKQLGFSNGQMVRAAWEHGQVDTSDAYNIERYMQVFCFYEGTRDVNPGYNKSLLSTRPFGVHLDVAGIMAKQVRIGGRTLLTLQPCLLTAIPCTLSSSMCNQRMHFLLSDAVFCMAA